LYRPTEVREALGGDEDARQAVEHALLHQLGEHGVLLDNDDVVRLAAELHVFGKGLAPCSHLFSWLEAYLRPFTW
jgi:hypothetical protein